MEASVGKAARLRRLTTPHGVIAAMAIDQRKSLRRMMAAAAGVDETAVSDDRLVEFKCAVVRALSPYASAVLIDPEVGLGAFGARDAACGLLTTYEMDGYENPRPHRMLALMPEFSVRRLRDLGSDGIKILLSYAPDDDAGWNDRKLAMIERIGAECEAMQMPFFLEPVGYDERGGDSAGIEYARRKPEIVLESMRELSKDIYKVDVLKVEFPVNIAYVEGASACMGQAAYSRAEAVACFRRIEAAAKRPYIYLSAGVSSVDFRESLQLAAEAGSRFSGVLCGRATWQDGISVYMRDGRQGLDQWLETVGSANIRAINECLRPAASLFDWRPSPGYD